MKSFNLKIIFIIAVLISVNTAFSQPTARVDERFELTSIAFRLSDESCFVHSVPENYIVDIDKYFSKYKDHEFIHYIKKTMYAKPVLEFSIITDLAADIKITPNGIIFNDEWITNYETDNCNVAKGDWTKAELSEYIRLLNKFYKDTKFHKFYDSHADFYAAAEKNLQNVVNEIDTAWFSGFFGVPFEMANIWLVPANGSHNFSLYRNDKKGKQYYNCAIGCSDTDTNGIPAFSYSTFTVLLHEICHNYNNPVCDQYWTEFQPICDTLFSYVGNMLSRNYYGVPHSILYEGMNRFCEFLYLMEHDTSTRPYKVLNDIREEERKGFVWLEELLRFGKVLRSQYAIFPTYKSFMPQLELFMKQVIENMEDYYYPKLKLMRPHVVATYPTNNSIVDTTITEVIIIFSEPMNTSGGNYWIFPVKDSDCLLLPVAEPCIWKDMYTYVIPLKEPLKSHFKYGFRVPDNYDWTIPIPLGVSCQTPYQYDLIFETK